MNVEVHGRYELELSARQCIHNGGWAAFARAVQRTGEGNANLSVLPYQQVLEHAIFATESAAISAAGGAAVALLRAAD